MNGIINIYKERGYTSHDVVAKARGILGIRKIGHTGTLDPEAEGVLPICIGKATKVSEILLNEDKRYVANVCLGITTTTEDATGEIIKERPVDLTKGQIEEVVESFIGQYEQIPPMYSALKVNGKKLYELAREGKEVKRKPRQVIIYDCKVIEYISPCEFVLDVKCSKGTYVRTLCSDIGEKLGTGAHMKSLLRTEVARFNISKSITLSQLEELMKQGKVESAFTEIDKMFLDLPKLHVKTKGNNYLYNGNQLSENLIIGDVDINLHKKVRIYDYEGVFVGIYTIRQEDSRI